MVRRCVAARDCGRTIGSISLRTLGFSLNREGGLRVFLKFSTQSKKIRPLLLRPGLMEARFVTGLPHEKQLYQILGIPSDNMENPFRCAELEKLASNTKDFSATEWEALVHLAKFMAQIRKSLNPPDSLEQIDEENINVTVDQLFSAFDELKPALSADINTLGKYRLKGMLKCGARHAHILQSVHTYVEQLSRSQTNPLSTCLLEGPCGCGKTALAATVGIDSRFPFVKIVRSLKLCLLSIDEVSAENMIGLSESTKCAVITEVFDDAYKSPLSIIILDDIERLIEFVHTGPRFSCLILRTILDLLKKIPPQGSKLLVIGTSSIILEDLESMKLLHAFHVHHNVPTLNPTDMKQVLEALNVFDPADVDNAVTALDEEIPIKRLLMLVDMAAQGGGKGTNVHQKIKLGYFYKCLQRINT